MIRDQTTPNMQMTCQPDPAFKPYSLIFWSEHVSLELSN